MYQKSIANSGSQYLPVLSATVTSHYQLGKAIGEAFKENIHHFLGSWDVFQTRLWPQTVNGPLKPFVEKYDEISRQYFPQYIRELEGIADGCHVLYVKLLVACLRTELTLLLESLKPKKSSAGSTSSSSSLSSTSSSYKTSSNMDTMYRDSGCSTIFVHTDKMSVLGHNEDTNHWVKQFAYFVNCNLRLDQKPDQSIMAYCYPGQLFGNAMSVSSHKLAITMNALSPMFTNPDGIPLFLFTRDLLSFKSAKEVVDVYGTAPYGRFKDVPCATGASLNVFDVTAKYSQPQYYNIELGPGKTSNVVTTEGDGFYCHTNMYQSELRGKEPEYIDRLASSYCRYERMMSFDVPSNINQLLRILGDTENNEYPIYKPGSKDKSVTVATGIFDANSERMQIFTESPKQEKIPVVEIKL